MYKSYSVHSDIGIKAHALLTRLYILYAQHVHNAMIVYKTNFTYVYICSYILSYVDSTKNNLFLQCYSLYMYVYTVHSVTKQLHMNYYYNY